MFKIAAILNQSQPEIKIRPWLEIKRRLKCISAVRLSTLSVFPRSCLLELQATHRPPNERQWLALNSCHLGKSPKSRAHDLCAARGKRFKKNAVNQKGFITTGWPSLRLAYAWVFTLNMFVKLVLGRDLYQILIY